MERFLQKQMRLDEMTEPGLGDVADYYWKRDKQYGPAELMVPAIVKPQTNTTAATPLPTTFGELMQTLDIVPRQYQLPQGSSRPGSSQMRLCSEKPQSHTDIESLLPDAVANSSPIENAKGVEPGSLEPRKSRP